MTSDEDLMDEMREGSRTAFETLFGRYREAIWAFFRRRTADAGRAEELARAARSAPRRRGARRKCPVTITGDNTTARELRGTIRVPGGHMAATLTRLRQVGQVVEDTQGSQDVTDHIVDLDARLSSARATEQRLKELIHTRTGKLSDVLEVERELTRVRLDIERLEADKTNVGRRVNYATIDVTIGEERKAGLEAGPLPIATRLRVAAADRLASAIESAALAVLFLLRAGPTLVFWGVGAGLTWLLVRRRFQFGIRDPR